MAAPRAAQANHQAGGRGGMPVRHAMLVITRAVFDMVEIPGQEPLVVAKDTGDEDAPRAGGRGARARARAPAPPRRWWDERVRAVAAGVFERNGDAWESELANWQASTDVAVGKERLHDGGPRVDVARIRFPDGSETVVDPQNAHDYVTEEFRARQPQPTVAAQFAEWRETVQVVELQTWVGWLFNGAEHMPVDLGLPVSQFGYPIREVLGCLDRLSADGWQIGHVSEDRSASLDGGGG